MKKTRGRRWLSLLLTLAMCLTLAPAAWAADDVITITDPEGDTLTIGEGRSKTLEAIVSADVADDRIAWASGDKSIASVNNVNNLLTANKPGKTTVYAFLQSDPNVRSRTLNVIVSGIAVPDVLEIDENQPFNLMTAAKGWCVGDASPYTLEFSSLDTYVLEVDGDYITGLREGEASVELRANDGVYTKTLKVRVNPDPYNEIQAGTLASGEVLRFEDLDFSKQMGGNVVYVTGLFVPTDRGTLYYGYRSEAEPGRGVGQVDTYYRNPSAGQWGLSGVTFVPRPTYPGGEVTITYTAVTENGQNRACEITLTIKGSSGTDSSTNGISLNTNYNTAVKFDSIEFGSICREQLGVQLDYIVFSQPPERQGALYTNYSSSGSYGSLVDIHRQYSRREIDDVWFVPAPGYSGSVTVYYTGFGTNGRSYSGQVFIKVEQEDSVATGGLSFSTTPGNAARFDGNAFDDYCKAILDDSQTIVAVRFESLPSESDGVLYYDYQSSVNTGTRAAAGTVYYYGTRAPRIDRLAFVPSADYTGVLKIPFTGWTTDGTSFSGNVEINVRAGVVSGDIYYYCAPGRSVSFVSSDFTNLSRTMTGRTLSYIRFRDLPSSLDGTVYFGSSRAGTGTYYYSSNLSRLSFRASSSFSGLVSIPFEGVSTGGDTFTAVITIGTSGSGTSGSGSSGSSGNIHYATDSKNAAVFYRNDFDDLSLWETNRSVSSVRFDVPSGIQGALYRGYRSSSSMGTRITSNTSITASDLDRVAFVPASGYTGTVYINFTATASGNGGSFTGTVEVDVDLSAADVTAWYSTHTEPVHFYASDLARSGSNLSSIRFTSLPSSGAGTLYYQYLSPIQYGQQVSTGTTYRASGGNLISDLTFVPRAGYSGTVTIPYTGTNSNGSTFTGTVEITVSPSYNSFYFSDMTGYSSAQLAAVDFLYNHSITRGLTAGQYGPESLLRRGDFALMLYQAFEFSPTLYNGAFRDVAPDAYYALAVDSLYANGVVSGVGNGYYSPNGTLTRQDAICMVQRAMRAVGWGAGDGYASVLDGYSDGSSVSGYAQGAMAMAIQRGYLPTSGGRLNPQQPLTRVDMAELLHRALTYYR